MGVIFAVFAYISCRSRHLSRAYNRHGIGFGHTRLGEIPARGEQRHQPDLAGVQRLRSVQVLGFGLGVFQRRL